MTAKARFRQFWRFLENLHLLFWIGTGLYAIATLSVFASYRDSLGSVPWYGWLCFGASTIAVVLLLLLLTRRKSPVRVDRVTMIATGNRLIRGVKHELVMFGGDMSWAPDYRDSVLDITKNGKHVTIVFPKSDAEKVKLNATTLETAGARMWSLRTDLGLRAMLIDPSDNDDALVYLVGRTLRKGGIQVASGEPGSSSDYEYLAQVFDTRHDRLLVRTIHKLYSAVSLSVGSA